MQPCELRRAMHPTVVVYFLLFTLLRVYVLIRKSWEMMEQGFLKHRRLMHLYSTPARPRCQWQPLVFKRPPPMLPKCILLAPSRLASQQHRRLQTISPPLFLPLSPAGQPVHPPLCSPRAYPLPGCRNPSTRTACCITTYLVLQPRRLLLLRPCRQQTSLLPLLHRAYSLPLAPLPSVLRASSQTPQPAVHLLHSLSRLPQLTLPPFLIPLFLLSPPLNHPWPHPSCPKVSLV